MDSNPIRGTELLVWFHEIFPRFIRKISILNWEKFVVPSEGIVNLVWSHDVIWPEKAF